MRRGIGEGRWQLRGGSFKAEGKRFVELLQQDAGLTPESQVLDLGCGCGRLAIPLTNALTAGQYAGLELNNEMVRWCSSHITPRLPHFNFFHQDLFNSLYNPRGTVRPETCRFPFEDASFDLTVATSVFTHLPPLAVINYARECSRVLKSGGKLFASFFLIENGTSANNAALNFEHVLEAGVALTSDPAVPERAIAYSLEWLLSNFEQQALTFAPPVRWGSWAGNHDGYSWQDVLIIAK
jgi:SAM-dependent methyltransferase